MKTEQEIRERLAWREKRLAFVQRAYKAEKNDETTVEQVRWVTLSLLQKEIDELRGMITALKWVLGES